MDTLSIMTKKDGHTEEHFDPKDEKDVKRIKKLVKDLHSQGYYGYAYDSKTGKYVTIQPGKFEPTDEALTEFVLAKGRKKAITPPQTGG